jgi:hypothetical protein
MTDTSTIGVSDKVGVIDTVILLSIFPVIVLWKWWDIGKSNQI